MRAHSCNRPCDPVGFGHSVVDRMSKLAQEIFEMIVELQGRLPSTSILILGLHEIRYKLASRACRQSVHSRKPVLVAGVRERLSASLGLKCINVHAIASRVAAKRTARFSPSLAHRKTGISRSGRRDVCRSGAWLAQLRVSCVDPRRRLLADRNGRRRRWTLRCLRRQFLSPLAPVIVLGGHPLAWPLFKPLRNGFSHV